MTADLAVLAFIMVTFLGTLVIMAGYIIDKLNTVIRLLKGAGEHERTNR